MGETRKLAALVVADVVGYGRLAAADEDRTPARLRGLRSNLIDPAIAADHGRIAKRTADGICSTGTSQLRHWDHNRDDRIMAEYGLPSGPHPDFELDHLIPLGIGGADDDRNLWPEPRRSIEPQWNAERKDRLEWKLRELVCDGNIPVSEAQRAISEDWTAAFVKFVGEPRRRFLFAALMLMAAIAAAANIPPQIVSADHNRVGGAHGRTAVSRMAAWPTFERAAIRRLDPAAIERAIGAEWAEAHARFAGEPR